MDFSDLVALKLDEILKEKEITLYKLQDLTGVYTSTVSMFLTRKTKTIRLENLVHICEGLNISLDKFFADERFKEAEATDLKERKNKKRNN